MGMSKGIPITANNLSFGEKGKLWGMENLTHLFLAQSFPPSWEKLKGTFKFLN